MTTRAELSRMACDESGHTPLMVAALNGDAKTARDLISCSADINARDDEGRTALMFAVINSHSDVAAALLKAGADIDATARDGCTALMLAVSSGDQESVQALLDKGADLSARYLGTDKTALVLAKERGYDDIVRLLEEAGARG